MKDHIRYLRAILYFIAVFHLGIGAALMFSVPAQKFFAEIYQAKLVWDAKDIYFIRVIGSFAVVLGTLAWGAAHDPLKNKIVILGLIEFFFLRNIARHLFSDELYAGFSVPPYVNTFTTFFFAGPLVLLAWLLWRTQKESR